VKLGEWGRKEVKYRSTFTVLYHKGDESCGKTTPLLKMITQNSKRGKICKSNVKESILRMSTRDVTVQVGTSCS